MKLAHPYRARAARDGLAALLLGLVLAGAGCVTVQSSEGGFVLGGRVEVDEGEVAREDIVVVSGSVRIDGEARRDVVVIGGSLVVNGQAVDVVCIGGSMRIGPGARIRGDVVNIGGSLSRSPGAEIEGEVVNVGISGFDRVPWLGHDPFSWGQWWGLSPFRVMARTTQLLYWLLLAVLTIALVGDRVSSAAHTIRREPIRLGAIGVVGFFALILLTGVFFVLSILVIGLPFLLATLLGWWLAYIFGMVAAFQIVGQALLRVLGKADASQLGLVVTGCVVLSILHYFPLIGTMAWWVAAFLGLGAVFATRFGTNRPWFGQAGAPVPPPAPSAPRS